MYWICLLNLFATHCLVLAKFIIVVILVTLIFEISLTIMVKN